MRTDYKRKDNLHIIYLRYSYNRKFVLFNTKVEASLLNWNKRLGRLRKSLHYEKKNEILEQFEKDFEEIVLNVLLQKQEPTLLNVKNEFYKAKNIYQSNELKPKKQDELKFLKDFQKFIDYQKDNDIVKEPTYKTYTTTKNKLSDFQKATNYFVHYDANFGQTDHLLPI